MYLRQIELIDFKNYRELNVDFGAEVNCLTGPNGGGKTNLLDAIHYLSMCRSYFTATDVQNIRHGAPWFMVKGTFRHDGMEEVIACSVREGHKKQFLRNGKPYPRMHEHIGRFPVVMIAPADQELVTGGSGERRRFMDRIIAQTGGRYLERLMDYQRALDQRNAVLRQATGSIAYDDATLHVWNDQLIAHGEKIHAWRKEFVAALLPLFEEFYRFVSGEDERATLAYVSHLENAPFEAALREGFGKDRILRHTTTGIHKDDLWFAIDGHSARKYGSQGQQKSFVMALKLAHFTFVRREKGLKPVVMLDDLFDKLDDLRVSRIIALVRDHSFGQLFISDTHPERVFRFLREAGIPFQPFAVRDGRVEQEAYA